MYEASGAARSILMTAAALGIKIEKKILDMEKEEHKSPEFLKVVLYQEQNHGHFLFVSFEA